MQSTLLLLPLVLGAVGASYHPSSECFQVDTIDRGLRDDFCEQPLFITIGPMAEEMLLIDNICLTFFPLPDDPDTFQIYISRVFCDGSNDIFVQIGTQTHKGVTRRASPFCTFTDFVFGYAGCDTYLVYRCHINGECGQNLSKYVYGVSPTCRSIGLSCLRKVEEIVRDQGLPDEEFYVMPMKLPNRCVTQLLCLAPSNPFYDKLTGQVSSFVDIPL